MSHIIARDFFPSLVHLDAANSYLDAVESADPTLISASVRRLEDLSATPAATARVWQTPGATPIAHGPSETPLRMPAVRDGEPPAKRPRLDVSLRLDDFQTQYTSEDNASFTEILDVENKRRRERYGWAWDAQRRVEALHGRMLEARERALIEAPPAPGIRERMSIEAPVSAGLITAGEGEEGEVNGQSRTIDNGKRRDDSADGQEESESVDVMAPKKDTRPAGVDGWKFKARNSLMFLPDEDISPYDAQSRHPISSKTMASKVIKHDNTRLPEQEESVSVSRGMSAPPSPTRSRIEAAILGTPYRPKPPGVNSFSYVPAMPSPTPSELGSGAVKQLMTMGTLLGTPRILSRSDDPAETPDTPFRIANPTAREELSQRLSSAASRSLRTKANLLGGGSTSSASVRRKGDMGPPSMTPRRADASATLTPAAKRLLNRTTMGTAAARRAEAMGRMAGWEGKKERDLNRVRWTPTPSPVTRR